MRKSKINRKTSETNISVEINLDGKGKFNISTGMLASGKFIVRLLSLNITTIFSFKKERTCIKLL